MTDFDLKRALRGQMRALRIELARNNPLAGVQAVNRLPGIHGMKVAGYRRLGSEMDPDPLMYALAKRGADLALPVCLAPTEPLVFRSWMSGDVLVPDLLGVAGPKATAVEVRPDVVIVPLLAFDRTGGRLGQGGGHYDRTLEQLRAEGPLFALGLAYAGQEVHKVPAEPHDQKLDAILTETGYIEVKKP